MKQKLEHYFNTLMQQKTLLRLAASAFIIVMLVYYLGRTQGRLQMRDAITQATIAGVVGPNVEPIFARPAEESVLPELPIDADQCRD